MPRVQSGVCREGNTAGIFITLLLVEDKIETARRVLSRLPNLTAQVAEAEEEPSLVSVVSIGAEAWQRLMAGPKPAGLIRFPVLEDGPRRAPSTPADLFLHIHSRRHDANFVLARRLMRELKGAVTLVEEVHGFKTRGERDLTGFVDGTENPKGEERAEVAVVDESDAAFAGGSYVSLQRYVHDLASWETHPVAEQEGIIGRTKRDDEELADETKPPTAHIARVVIEEDGEELAILRHSMPYGTTSECGLYFIAYGSTPGPFAKMLKRMVKRDQDGHYDRLLDFSRPVTGASFFAPSVDMLEALS